MATEFEKKFAKNSTLKKKHGRWECECKRGLWGVSAPTKKSAKNEGRHYFAQYESDGEYDG